MATRPSKRGLIGGPFPWDDISTSGFRGRDRSDEPGDFWSQSFSYGSSAIRAEAGKLILIRFRNDGGKRYLRAEAHLVQATGQPDPLKVTYAWTDSSGPRTGTHVFRGRGDWRLRTGLQVRTRWVEFEPVR
jgi:hypothetical protein